ncbi:MAG: hypothetical protein RBT47_11765 [Anaerolineae bacterium]|jgi:hypothetical protein|nr:hypothetical protein [Anaerolineae bacterium]
MDTGKEEAKKLFFEFACNHFYMDHDGMGETYAQFDVSEAEEAQWRQEYIALWVSRLSTEDLTAVNSLTSAWAGEALPALIAMADKGDSYARLWYANALWDLATGISTAAETHEQAIQTAVRLWRSLSQGPIELSESHRAMITPSSMNYLEAATPEEYVRNYAKRRLLRFVPGVDE